MLAMFSSNCGQVGKPAEVDTPAPATSVQGCLHIVRVRDIRLPALRRLKSCSRGGGNCFDIIFFRIIKLDQVLVPNLCCGVRGLCAPLPAACYVVNTRQKV